jgi:hypothetical protein
MYAAIYDRIADGTAADSPTATFSVDPSSGQMAVILRVTGHAGTPFDVASGSGSGNATTLAIPSVTVANAASLMVGAVGFLTGGSAVTATWPSPWSERVDFWHSAGVRHSIFVGTREVNAGSSPSGEGPAVGAANVYASSVAVYAPAGGAGAAKPVLFHSHYQNMGWR